MRYDMNHSKTGAANTMFRVFVLSVLCLVLLATPVFCSGCLSQFAPPDLSSCTHLEIRYPPSTLNYFLPDTGIQETVLSAEEKKYIESFEHFTVKDPERIKAFAHGVSLGFYDGRRREYFLYASPVEIRCYRNEGYVISFTVFSCSLMTEDWRQFSYPRCKMPDLEIIEPAEMQPFKLRYQCGLNMQRIHTSGPLHYKDVRLYPEPGKWCDAVTQERTNTSYVSEDKMRGSFKCPTVGEDECHYALNPDCEPNSPGDTVLLLESDAGWNSYGGPELFTFEHHEPRGGCIMLNDGTVKFIRTREELQQLRWK